MTLAHLNDDRSYWRGQDNRALIEAARYSPTTELCIALAERLERDAYDGETACDLNEQLSMCRATVVVMRAEIEALEAQVDDLLDQQARGN